MATYFAVCNCNGPISKEINADTLKEALEIFESSDHQSWCDDACTDAEDDLDFCGDGMSEDEFANMLEQNGCKVIADLESIVNGHTMSSSHILNGWMLWKK